MKLPRGKDAIVEIEKIRDYCLSEEHLRGRHKERVFAATLGLTARESEKLRSALLQVAIANDAIPGITDEYGARYIIDFDMEHDGKRATVRSCWIVRTDETAPRFVTCFVL